MDIAGHAALVSGAASGLGAATARALAAKGAKVACLDLNLGGAEEVASAIGGKAFQADVADAASAWEALLDFMPFIRVLIAQYICRRQRPSDPES